jgi:hypothetical protein
VSVFALCTVAFTLFATPSDPAAPPNSIPLPDPEEVELLGELVEWISGTPAEGGSFHAFEAGDLSDAIRSRPQSFELFRKYNGSEASRRFLREVPYGDAIFLTARRYELDSLLLAALVEVESGFRPEVVSAAGAIGLTQLMPDTAAWLGASDVHDPEANLDTGARYLSFLLDQYDGDVSLALAAYNAGPGNVDRFGDIPPFRETRSYVDRVLGRYLDHHQRVWRTSGPDQVRALAGLI